MNSPLRVPLESASIVGLVTDMKSEANDEDVGRAPERRTGLCGRGTAGITSGPAEEAGPGSLFHAGSKELRALRSGEDPPGTTAGS